MRNRKVTRPILVFAAIFVIFAGFTGCDRNGNMDGKALLTVGGRNVGEIEARYFLYASANTMRSYMPYVEWSDVLGDTPVPDYIRNEALNAIKFYHTIHMKAIEYSAGLSDIQRADLEQLRNERVSGYGSEQAFNEYLESTGIDDALYRYFNETNALYENLIEALFGENGSMKASDDVLIKFAQENGHIRATHILLMTVDDFLQRLPDDEVQRKRELAEYVHGRAIAGDDFFSLLFEYGEDPGVAVEPYSYDFTSGVMVVEFEKAAFDLKENEISDIVETFYGFHIIMRLPIDPESVRYEHAGHELGRLINDWSKDVEFTLSDEWNSIDVRELYENFHK